MNLSNFGVRVPMIAGAITAGLGYGLLHFVDAGTPLIGLMLPFLLIPSGMGLAVRAMTTAVLASTDATRAGTASAGRSMVHAKKTTPAMLTHGGG